MTIEIEDIKDIIRKWRDNKCIHCGTQMVITTMGDEISGMGCPNCIWNDSRAQNQHRALSDIGEIVGEIFWLTGASNEKKI